MSTKDVLFELFEDNIRRMHWLLGECSDECLHWQPDPQANSIAVTIWHVSRVFDVFLTQNILIQSFESELWFRNRFAERCGYNPNGLGSNGWGMLTGYTNEETRQIPNFNRETLKTYFDETTEAVLDYLKATDEESLMGLSPGYEGKQTYYFWVRHPLFDLTRHVGEMMAIKAIWERKFKDQS